MQQKVATRLVMFGLGFLSIGFQITLMREFMIVFNGNELVIAILLGLWLFLTGMGSLSARLIRTGRERNGLLWFLLSFLGLWPVVAIVLLHIMKSMFIPAGSMAGLAEVIIWGAVAEMPFCLSSGLLFILLSTGTGFSKPASAYSWESAGSILAGGIFNFLFLWIFNAVTSLLVLSGLWFLLCFISALVTRNYRAAVILVLVTVSFFIICLATGISSLSMRLQFPEQEVIEHMGTPYGEVVVTRSHGQYNYYENSLLLFSTGNSISNEECVHPAMLQHPSPRKVLIISGGFAGLPEEIRKYDPGLIDYVELNPALLYIAARYTKQLNHKGLRVYEQDARRFLMTTTMRYDVVLVNLPPPSTIQINRYYTDEFVGEIKLHMTDSAIISYILLTTSDYVSKEAAGLHSAIYRTMKKHFEHVAFVPLERNILLASDMKPDIDLPLLVEKRNIPTLFINKHYLDSRQLQERSSYIMQNVVRDGPVNSDFKPIAVYHQLSRWLGYFSIDPKIPAIIIVLLFIIMLVFQNSISAGLFTGGFSLASAELIIIMGYQMLFGFIFGMIGLIIMIFMAGLAIGSWFGTRFLNHDQSRLYFWLQLALALYSFMLPLTIMQVFPVLHSFWASHVLLVILALIPGYIVGIEYHLAVAITAGNQRTAVAVNYSADLFGSAAGAIVMGTILIPLSGIIIASLVLAGMNLFSAVLLHYKQKKIIIL